MAKPPLTMIPSQKSRRFFPRQDRNFFARPIPDKITRDLKTTVQNAERLKEFFVPLHELLEKIEELPKDSCPGFSRIVERLSSGGTRRRRNFSFDVIENGKTYRLHVREHEQPSDAFLADSPVERTMRMVLQRGNGPLNPTGIMLELNYRMQPGREQWAARSNAFFGRSMTEKEEETSYRGLNDFYAWFMTASPESRKNRILDAIKNSKIMEEEDGN